MSLKLPIITLLLATLCLTACQKGEIGPQGLQGPKGEQGIPGTNGNLLLNGTGVPASTLGRVGDYYLDKTSSELYGPKGLSDWPTGISLKGSIGSTGASGSKILSGETSPAANLGAVGDFYFNTNNADFYGAKTASGWGAPLNLKGGSGISSITTFIFNNQSVDNVQLKSTDIINGITSYYFGGKKTIAINYPIYSDTYETGLIYVRVRKYNDNTSYWQDSFAYYSTSIPETYRYHGYSIEGINIKKETIELGGYEFTTEDPDGNDLKNFKFDIKVVMIPSGVVINMKAKNIDIDNPISVSRFLNLQ